MTGTRVSAIISCAPSCVNFTCNMIRYLSTWRLAKCRYLNLGFQFVLGKIPYYTMPPTRSDGEHSEAKIVSEFGKEFNADEVYGNESSFIGSLKSVNDFNPIEVPSNSPLNLDDQMLEVCGLP